MALGSDPSGQEIAGEFGSSTRNQVNGSSNTSLYDLSAMYSHIFGSGNHSRTAFGGYGKLTDINVSTNSAVAGGESIINITLSANTHGLEMSYYITYSSQDSSDSGSYSGSGGGSFGVTIEDVNEGETYDIVVQCWNDFTSHPSDRDTFNRTQKVEEQESNQFPTPFIDSATFSGSSSVDVRWEYGDEPDSFSAQYRDQNNTTWQFMNLQQSGSWGSTTTSKFGLWQIPVSNTGSFPEVRIRANDDGNTQASEWSSSRLITS